MVGDGWWVVDVCWGGDEEKRERERGFPVRLKNSRRRVRKDTECYFILYHNSVTSDD